MKNKVIQNLSELSGLFKDNQVILAGGFGLSGAPLTIIDQMAETDVKGLHVVSNNLGDHGIGLHKLFLQGKIEKAIGSFFTMNREAVMLGRKVS